MGEPKIKKAPATVPLDDEFDAVFHDYGKAEVFNKKGNPVGYSGFLFEDQPYKSLPNTMNSGSVFINEDYRKKGIGTKLYKAAEDYYGRTILPDDVQSTDGFSFHANKGYGQEFGLSEDDLKTKLSPMDNNLRNMRKEALERTLNEVADGVYNAPGEGWEYHNRIANGALRNKPEGDRTNLGTLLDKGMDSAWDKVNHKLDGNKLRKQIPNLLSKVKSLAPALPFVGTAMALGSGDANAMAEELPGEIPFAGQAYEALRSAPAGDAMDDRTMIAERDASANYAKSGARVDALNKIKRGY